MILRASLRRQITCLREVHSVASCGSAIPGHDEVSKFPLEQVGTRFDDASPNNAEDVLQEHRCPA